MDSETLVEHSTHIEHHWWVSRPDNMDAFWVFVSRYEFEDGEPIKQEYYADTWHEYSGFDVIRPAMVLPGPLVQTLFRAKALDRSEIASSLEALCEEIWAKVQEKHEQ